MGLLEGSDHLVAVVLGHPRRHRLVQDVGVLRPLTTRGEPRLLGELRTAHEPHHPNGDALRTGGDRDPPPVAGEVCVAGSVVGGPVAGALLHLVKGVPDGRLGSDHSEDGFDDGEVDYLTPSGGLPGPQRRPDGRPPLLIAVKVDGQPLSPPSPQDAQSEEASVRREGNRSQGGFELFR